MNKQATHHKIPTCGLLRTAFVFFLVSVCYAQQSPHGEIRFECRDCHATDSWKMNKDGAFKHTATGFALTGKHAMLQCVTCHDGLKFTQQSTDCFLCHTDIHKSELGNVCLRCHTTQTWKIADMLTRHQQTRFPLLGRHATLACRSCHPNAAQNQYASTQTECIGCHRSDYNQSRSPNHAASGFATDCVQCHQVAAFTWGSGFDHQLTSFPLAGAHQAAACIQCHGDNRFRGLPSACIGCHRTDFSGTTNPPHAAGGFSTECLTCHSQAAWRPATFNHGGTGFPLTGRHTATACASCHVNNNYTLTYQDCFQCHAAQFAQPTNPNHVTSQFSHNCTPCHTTATWLPATFNHDAQYFRIYSGKHRNKWTACSQCHPASGQLQVFTCLSCHEHEQASMDQKHRNRSGYLYSSPACYTCHRNA